MNEIVITFTPDGTGHALYTEAIDLAAIGPLEIQRATTIEFNNKTQYWQVRDPRGFPLFNSPSRQACLDWERQHLQAKEDQEHELPYGPGAVTAGMRGRHNQDLISG